MLETDPPTLVELSTYEPVDARDMTRRIGVISLSDIGIEDEVARARIVKFNVFHGSVYGCVPVLRLATAYDRGNGLCLSQAINGSKRYPVMGETALVSPITEQLLENEMDIALNAFLVAIAA
jgi:hypothetical protein